MTDPDSAFKAPRATLFGGAAAAVMLGLAVAVSTGWFSGDPEEVDTTLAIELTTTSSSAVTTTTAPTTTEVMQSVDDLTGTWNLVQSDETFLGYRINEGVGEIEGEAVGRTPSVTGSLVATANTVDSVSFTASLSDLASNSPTRDKAMETDALETALYPDATFELTRPISIPDIPLDGIAVSFIATGNLSLHGVTRAVDLPLHAATTEGQLIVVGAVTITLADYEIDTSAPAVASVADVATIELSLLFSR